HLARPPPLSTPIPTRRSSDLTAADTVSWYSRTDCDDQRAGSSAALDHCAPAVFDAASLPEDDGEGPGCDEEGDDDVADVAEVEVDRKSTRLNSSHVAISYAVF